MIVVGGDCEGVAAALAAARAGASTLLVDTRPSLGGLLTHGWLNTIDMNVDTANRPLNGGIFLEIYRRLDDQSFDVVALQGILQELVEKQTGLDCLNNVLTVLPVVDGRSMPLLQPGQTLQPDSAELPAHLLTKEPYSSPYASASRRINGVEIFCKNGTSIVVKGKMFIDATQDADLAVAAGARHFAYGKDVWGSERNMAMTLVLRLAGISDSDWEKMCLAASGGRESLLAGGRRRSLWGFGEIMKKFAASNKRLKMRGLNLGRQNDKTVLVNALLLFGFDGLAQNSRREARIMAENELPALQRFLRTEIPGMQEVEIIATAPELYVRTSRQIEARYLLTVDDVLENADFSDRIGFGSYPLDIQAQVPDHGGDVTGNPKQYAVPLRSLIPQGFANLMVVGRSAGFASLAQSSARTVPVGMAAGQGAGIAAVVCLRREKTLEQIQPDDEIIGEIQASLAAQGVVLTRPPLLPPEITCHWSYPGIKFMRAKGQISGGYQNQYFPDKPISGRAFANRVVSMFSAEPARDWEWLYDFCQGREHVTLMEAFSLLFHLKNRENQTKISKENLTENAALEFLRQKNAGFFAPPWPADQAHPDSRLSRGAAYMLIGRWFNLIEK